MAIKHGKMVTHCDVLPTINSHNPLNMCSREVTSQIKNISPPSPNAYGYKTYQRNDITQRVPTHKVACPLNKVFM